MRYQITMLLFALVGASLLAASSPNKTSLPTSSRTSSKHVGFAPKLPSPRIPLHPTNHNFTTPRSTGGRFSNTTSNSTSRNTFRPSGYSPTIPIIPRSTGARFPNTTSNSTSRNAFRPSGYSPTIPIIPRSTGARFSNTTSNSTSRNAFRPSGYSPTIPIISRSTGGRPPHVGPQPASKSSSHSVSQRKSSGTIKNKPSRSNSMSSHATSPSGLLPKTRLSASKTLRPSGFSTLPSPTTTTRATAQSNSTINPFDLQPVVSIMTTVVNGTTEFLPFLVGGALTAPQPIALTSAPTLIIAAAAATSSASSLSSSIMFVLFPLLLAWTDDPTEKGGDAIKGGIRGVLPEVESLYGSIGGDPTQIKGPCNSKKRDLSNYSLNKRLPNPFKALASAVGAAFHTLACIESKVEEYISKIKIGPGLNGVDDIIKSISGEMDDLEKEAKDLDTDDNNDNSSDDNSSDEDSSSSCTKTFTVTDVIASCFLTPVPETTTIFTTTCTTSTSVSTITGCSASALTTTMTEPDNLAVDTFSVIDEEYQTPMALDHAFIAAILAEITLDSNFIPGNPTADATPPNGSPTPDAPIGGPGGLPCYNFADPEQEVADFCTCTNGASTPVASETGTNTGTAYQPCPWTVAPAPLDKTQFPFKTTLSNGQVEACETSIVKTISGDTSTLCSGSITTLATPIPSKISPPKNNDQFPFTTTLPNGQVEACGSSLLMYGPGYSTTLCIGSITTLAPPTPGKPAPTPTPVPSCNLWTDCPATYCSPKGLAGCDDDGDCAACMMNQCTCTHSD